MADLAARHRRVAVEAERRVLEVLRSGRYIGGPVVAEAEAAVAARFGRALGVGVNSGTDALAVALRAAGVRRGDEVIVPAVSFFATAEAVRQVGALPVVVDVLADRPLLDPDAVLDALGPTTRAVVPVHLFGVLAEVPPLPDGVVVVDDAAQAAGGSPPRSVGVASAVSFYPTKVLGAAGDGGMVLTDAPDVAAAARAIGSHGMRTDHDHHLVSGAVGGNTRLDALQAAVVLAHLEDIDARAARRRTIAAAYDAAFGGSRLVPVPRDAGSPVSVYAVCVDGRDAVAAALAEVGIGTSVYYPRPMGTQPALADLPARCRPPTPHADRFCAVALALPCHVGMTDDDVVTVIAGVVSALQETATR